VDGWREEETNEQDGMVVGRRRMRIGRRRFPASRLRWAAIAIVAVLVAGAGVVGVVWLNRPTGLAALPNPTVVTPGGFRASIGANDTITVGLEVRNVADVAITVVEARILAPAGLTSIALTVVPTGPDNIGFALEGDLPPTSAVQLGVATADRNAIIAARFKVDCSRLLTTGGATGEQIFVTIKVGDASRTEELTPPVVDGVPWLTATAHRACVNPVPTSSAQPPLPPLPDQSVRSTSTPSG
jgi:hypothetical protein